MIPIRIQYPEHNVTKKEIQERSGDGLLVHSHWYSIQGEGPFAGIPAYFIRLAGCNRGAKIDCAWCDTNFRMDEASVMSVNELLECVNRGLPGQAPLQLVVITGGEPLLHSNVRYLAHALENSGRLVQFETNGDLLHSYKPVEATSSFFVVSPKVSAYSGRYSEIKDEAKPLIGCLKFLVSSDPDSPYHHLPEYAFSGAFDVFLSPINEYRQDVAAGEVASFWDGIYDPDRCAANYAYAAKLCMEHGFRLSLQTHIFASVR